MVRFQTILDKYFEQDAKATLLAELKQWNLSIALVNQIIVEETSHVDRSNKSPSDTIPTSNASTVQHDINKDNNASTIQHNTGNHNNANTDQHDTSNPNNATGMLPGAYNSSPLPSPTASFDNDDSTSNEPLFPWLVNNINIT
ncbi:hypothetical protein DFQ28_002633 [Apophysomyces sp. BC1034]|nr:hypothetical protein DFQ29_001678 [Apophysomyces sp. BC1021]KAG0189999.1 hypothetical protein DFQ28_002633 [Apophysomyces sp. BC1034]